MTGDLIEAIVLMFAPMIVLCLIVWIGESIQQRKAARDA